MISPKTNQARKLFHDGCLALNKSTMRGMRIDVGYCEKTHKKLNHKLKILDKRIKQSKFGRRWNKIYSNMNIRSDQQLSNILFDKMKMPVIKKTDKGNPSVDAEVLDTLSKNVSDLKKIAKYKTLYVANNTFIKAFLREHVDGYLHPAFPLNITKTFRSSSEGPNFQQFPKRNKLQKKIVRRAIIPRKGHQIIEADYGGIEVRIAACVTGDKKLAYDAVHGDMHRDMAIEIFLLDEFEKKGYEKELRFAGKNGFVFAQFYGDYWGNNVPTLLKLSEMPLKGKFKKENGKELMTGIHLGEHLINKNIKTIKQFEKHVEKIEYNFWNKRYKTYGKWKKDQVDRYSRTGWLETKTGFLCQGVMSKNEINNYQIQGPAFHCLLKDYIETDRRQTKQKWDTYLMGQIHDAMVFDVHPKEKDLLLEELKDIMIDWLPKQKQFRWVNIPLEVEADIFPVDGTWASESETIKF